jgi:hypothetical protein
MDSVPFKTISISYSCNTCGFVVPTAENSPIYYSHSCQNLSNRFIKLYYYITDFIKYLLDFGVEIILNQDCNNGSYPKNISHCIRKFPIRNYYIRKI